MSFLQDHKRNKKKILAPMNFLFQSHGWKVEYIEVNFEKNIIPEIFWLTYMNEYHGIGRTSHIITRIIVIANEIKGVSDGSFNWISGLASSFNRLSVEQKDKLLIQLKKEDLLFEIVEAISPIKYLFPNCPINFLITDCSLFEKSDEIRRLKNILDDLYDKTGPKATFTISHVIYPLILVGGLQINKNINISPKDLLDYPNTEKSQLIGGFLRNSIRMLDANILQHDKWRWRSLFWERCFELEPPKI